MLSVSCKAAIKAVIYLGSKFDSAAKCGIQEIAEFINENEHTVGKILQKLVKANIINSNKGPNGGFYITAQQKKQAIIKIVEAIDGKDVFRQCGLGLSKCSETRPCPIHKEYKTVKDLFQNLCEKKTINDLYSKLNDGLSYLVG